MKKILKYLLIKSGIYGFVWDDFCRQYPVRLGADNPEVKKYLETQHKVVEDMLLYGMGCTQYVDPKTVKMAEQDGVVIH